MHHPLQFRRPLFNLHFYSWTLFFYSSYPYLQPCLLVIWLDQLKRMLILNRSSPECNQKATNFQISLFCLGKILKIKKVTICTNYYFNIKKKLYKHCQHTHLSGQKLSKPTWGKNSIICDEQKFPYPNRCLITPTCRIRKSLQPVVHQVCKKKKTAKNSKDSYQIWSNSRKG